MKKVLLFLLGLVLLIQPLVLQGMIFAQDEDFESPAALDKLNTSSQKFQQQIETFWVQFNSEETPFDINKLFENITENTSLTDVIIFSIGMVIYGIFIYHFYQLIARRDIVTLGIQNKIDTGARAVSIGAYILKYIIVFPLIIFVWFFVYSMFMFFLAPDVEMKFVFLVVISLVLAIRITAYYKEDLSKDFAKMIPFAILGIFLASGSFFTIEQVQERIDQLIPFIFTVLQFVIIAIFVEAILRIIYLIKRFVTKSAKTEVEDAVGEKVADKIEDMVEEEVQERLNKVENKIDKKLEVSQENLDKVEDKMDEKIEKSQNGFDEKWSRMKNNLKEKADSGKNS